MGIRVRRIQPTDRDPYGRQGLQLDRDDVGRIDRFTTSMLFAIAFLFTFTIGGLSGVTFATVPIDWQVTDSYYVVAHMHYVLFGGTLFAVMAGTYYWFPKMSGRMLSERWGVLHFWLMFIGFHLTFFIQHILGLDGMPRRVYTYADHPGWAAMNMISTVGAFVIGISVLVFLTNIVVSLRHGAIAGDNPWDAWTLEWATTSPPPEHNFDRVPPVCGQGAVGSVASTGRAFMKRYDTTKLAMAVFLASELVFFAFLIAAYIYFYSSVVQGPRASNSLHPPRTLVFTICLLASSGTMWIAERRLGASDKRGFRLWLGLTILLGAAFIFGQATEYAGLIAKTITPARNLFGATFFTLTGFHGLHVLGGLISLSALLGLTFKKTFGAKEISGVGAISLYWHFVDAVWILIFGLVYVSVWK